MAVHPDLAGERAAASFDVRLMTYLLDRDVTGARTASKERVRALIPQNEAPWAKDEAYFLSRKDRFKRALLLHRSAYNLADARRLSEEERAWLTEEIGEVSPLGTSDLIFKGGIRSLGDEAQQTYWIPKCERYEVVGAYAQTELGHGSNIKKLEMTAIYDAERCEFELNCPTLTSSKWWPGTLGACATHALVFAMLRIAGRHLGMHAFVVPIRDPATHHPLPGVKVGDIGPKLGMNTVDNGFLRLERVRVPLEAMLCKYAQVAADGTYSKPKNAQANYATMLLARVSYTHTAFISLASAATVAGRYACVRRQGGEESGGEELKIIEWRTHQRALLPIVATAYALHFVGSELRKIHARVLAGDAAQIGGLHITVSAIKVMVTSLASRGMETCRRLCGGHGYSLCSGIPEKWATFTHTETAEGDNVVLTLQVARGLLKSIGRDAALPHLTDPEATLAEACAAASAADFMRVDVLLHALRHRACALVSQLAASQRSRSHGGASATAAWRCDLNLALRVGRAQSELMMVEFFASGLDAELASLPAASSLSAALHRLCALFALDLLELSLADLLQDGYFSAGQVAFLREAIEHLLEEVRIDLVALVDAFNISDYQLHSCIGRSDGNVYQALWDHAQAATVHLCDSGPDGVVDGWREGILPGTCPAASKL